LGSIRLFLALAVLSTHSANFFFAELGHAAEDLPFGINGGRAVMMFFTVSGFLMSYVLGDKYDRPGGTLAFYRARFLRIYPLWWAMLLIVVPLFGAAWLRYSIVDKVATFVLLGSDWRTAFASYPTPYGVVPGALGVGWSLAPEVAFYAIAPFVLRSVRLSAALCAASAALRYAIYSHFSFGDPWLSLAYYWFPSLLMFFLLGHFARLLWQRLDLDRRYGLLLLPATLWMMSWAHPGPFDNPYFYIGMICFALALPPVFELTKKNHVMNMMGALSYPLYLTHRPLIEAARPYTVEIKAVTATLPLDPIWQFAVASLAGCAIMIMVAALAHRTIEPWAGWLVACGLDRLRFRPHRTSAVEV
jgi:peptidoglycan/LPS O-acetylase OafA/YrhL